MLLGNVRDIGDAYLLEITEPKVFLFRRIHSLCLFRKFSYMSSVGQGLRF